MSLVAHLRAALPARLRSVDVVGWGADVVLLILFGPGFLVFDAVLRRVVGRRTRTTVTTFRPGPVPDAVRSVVAHASALAGGALALAGVLWLAFNTVLAGGGA